MLEANKLDVIVALLFWAIHTYQGYFTSGSPGSTALTVLVTVLLIIAVTTLYCVLSYAQEDLEAGAVSIRFRILELMIVITIMGAIVIYVIQIHMVLRSIGLVAIPAISTIACVLSTEVRALFHRARTWVVQGLRARKQLLSWALLWIMPTGFLEGIVHNAARHQLDLTPGRDDIDLEDVAIYWNETFSSEV